METPGTEFLTLDWIIRNIQLTTVCVSSIAHVVSCPPGMRLLARNGLVNEVEFLGPIPQNGGRPMRL